MVGNVLFLRIVPSVSRFFSSYTLGNLLKFTAKPTKNHERSVEIGFKSPQRKLRMTLQTPMGIQAVQQFHSSKFGIFKNLMSQTNDKVPADTKSDVSWWECERRPQARLVVM